MVRPDGRGDFATIQAAIDATESGDTIDLANGTFRGAGNRDIIFRGRSIHIRSRAGNPEACVIDCEGSATDPHRGFSLSPLDTLTIALEGFSIINGYGVGGGGAIKVEKGGIHLLQGLIFRANGNGAVDCLSASLSLENCRFETNPDGGLCCWDASDVRCSATVFIGNGSGSSGGGIMNSSSAIELNGCVFDTNTALFSGGAIASSTIADSPQASTIVVASQFRRNSSGYHGGALDLTQTNFHLVESSFFANYTQSNGGAVWSYRSSGAIDNCVFYGNEGGKGGVINCGWDSSPSIRHSIIAFNSGSAPVFCDTLLGEANPSFECSDIYGNYGGDWVGCIASQSVQNGNITADPLFCDPSNEDLRLRPNSPCADPGCGRMGPLDIGCTSQ